MQTVLQDAPRSQPDQRSSMPTCLTILAESNSGSSLALFHRRWPRRVRNPMHVLNTPSVALAISLNGKGHEHRRNEATAARIWWRYSPARLTTPRPTLARNCDCTPALRKTVDEKSA